MSSRNKKKFVDYVLYQEPGVPIAVVEAKDNHHTVSHGMQQALGYAEILEVHSAFSSNGDAFASHNKAPADGEDIETQFPLENFPPPQTLWKRYKTYRGKENENANSLSSQVAKGPLNYGRKSTHPFYLCYRENQKLQPMVAEIGWTHNLIILDKCKDDLEREFYLRMTRKYGWTKDVLAIRIQDQTYEKTLLGQNNFNETLSESISPQAKLALMPLSPGISLPTHGATS